MAVDLWMVFREHIRPTLRLAIPIAASQVSDMLTLLVDNIMVGKLGTVPLAATTFASSISVVVMLFAIGFTVAITPLAGAAFGRRDMAEVARHVKAGAIVSLTVAVILVAGLLCLAPYLSIFGAPPDVALVARPFYFWLVLSFLPRVIFGIFKQTAEAMSNTRVALIVAVLANVLNLAFNWMFIYGNLGMPQMGVEGSGFATFLARSLMAVFIWLIFIRSPFFLRLRSALRTSSLDGARLRESLRRAFFTGLPIAGQIILEVMAFAAGAVMMGWLGAVPLAAHQIAIGLASLTFMVALGLSSAATIRISQLHGKGDREGVKAAGYAAMVLVLVYNVITATLFLTLRHELPYVYVNDPAVIALAAQLLIYAGLFQIFDGMQTVGLGILRGVNDVRIPTIIATIAYGLVALPVSYICAFPLGFGAPGVWIGYLVGLAVAAGLYGRRALRGPRTTQENACGLQH